MVNHQNQYTRRLYRHFMELLENVSGQGELVKGEVKKILRERRKWRKWKKLGVKRAFQAQFGENVVVEFTR